jgi:hypothetical protein
MMSRSGIRSAMRIENRFLLNFAASCSEGGYKRLRAYATWFNQNGGAWFAIHPRCSDLITEFPHNQFFIVRQSHVRRLYDDWGYLASIGTAIGRPDVYYAYGIPLYVRFGHLNWFHLSNVLPLGARAIPLSTLDRLKFKILGRRIRRGFALADIISAESQHSLELIGAPRRATLLLSVNGSNDELAYARQNDVTQKDNIATVVGTYRYKALNDSWRVFQKLKSDDNRLKLVIIGEAREVPAHLRHRSDVIVRGVLERAEVLSCLRRTKFYISTTYVENRSNSVSEGTFHADQSYISDIPSNRELLRGSKFARVYIAGVSRPLLHVRRNELSSAGLCTWEAVVSEWRTAALRALHNLQPARADRDPADELLEGSKGHLASDSKGDAW